MQKKLQRKLSFWEVSLAVANSMIGLSLLYFPELFLKSGIIIGVLSLIILAIMMSYTCTLWAQHLNYDENDIGQVVLRVLKKPMYIIFSLSSGIALCLLTTAIFLMIAQLCYILLIQIFEAAHASFSYRKDTNEIHFQQFSVQYLGLILLIPLGFLLCLKSINKVLAITRYASLLMMAFIVQVFVFFIQNISTSRVRDNGIKLFPSDVNETIGLLSTALFAFISHPSVSPILKSSKNPMTYAFTMTLFIMIGVFGGIGLVGRVRKEGNTVISYFIGQTLSYTMAIPILLYLFAIFSIYPYVARNQLLGLLQFFKNKTHLKEKYHYFFSIGLIVFLLFALFINLNPGLIISFIGAVMCWLACFLFPCLIRLKEGKPRYDIQSLISQQQLIPQRIRVSTKEKIWIGIVIATGTLLMIAQLYYVIAGLVSPKES